MEPQKMSLKTAKELLEEWRRPSIFFNSLIGGGKEYISDLLQAQDLLSRQEEREKFKGCEHSDKCLSCNIEDGD